MDRNRVKRAERARRRRRIRKKISGTAARPRLSVFRSLKHIYAQIIDDDAGKTLAAVSSRSGEQKGAYGGGVKAAEAVGKRIAQLAQEKRIEAVVFDRGGYQYHGRVKALAQAARKGGLKF